MERAERLSQWPSGYCKIHNDLFRKYTFFNTLVIGGYPFLLERLPDDRLVTGCPRTTGTAQLYLVWESSRKHSIPLQCHRRRYKALHSLHWNEWAVRIMHGHAGSSRMRVGLYNHCLLMMMVLNNVPLLPLLPYNSLTGHFENGLPDNSPLRRQCFT